VLHHVRTHHGGMKR